MAPGVIGIATVGDRVGDECGERAKEWQVRPEPMADGQMRAVKLPCTACPEPLSRICGTPEVEIDDLWTANGREPHDFASFRVERVAAAYRHELLMGEGSLIRIRGFSETFDENCVTGKGTGPGGNVCGRWHAASLAQAENAVQLQRTCVCESTFAIASSLGGLNADIELPDLHEDDTVGVEMSAPDDAGATDATGDTVVEEVLADRPVGEAPLAEPETGFAALGLRKELLKALTGLGYEEPTPIQRETIPLLLSGRDLVGQAATGTGKTAAFALPILQMIEKSKARPEAIALVLVPTRELAVQVSEAMYKYGRELGAQVVPIYGGQPIGRQLQALNRGVHVVVATPGRALDHIARNTLNLNNVKMVVLDEADEMLDMGFADDIEEILRSTPEERQTVLFSATMPGRITSIARRHLRDPLKIQTGAGDTKMGKALVRQTAYIVQRSHKPAALGRILDIEAPAAAIVFCRTRTEVDQLTETMSGRGYRAEALHGGMSQEQRDRVMGRLKSGAAELLIATDVAARGLDVDSLTHVVNYDVPAAPESYVHRIGRVGRAGREGIAITLAEPKEQRLLANIERLTKQKIAFEKVPSVADLRARQIEITITTIKEALEDDDLDKYASVLDALSEVDLRQVALAAIKLTHAATGATVDEREIPDAMSRVERPGSSTSKFGKPARGNERDRGNDRGNDRYDRGAPRSNDRYDRGAPAGRAPSSFKGPSTSKGAGAPRDFAPRSDSGSRSDSRFDVTDVATIFISVGRSDGIRAGDLVGAIANESNLSGREIGPIKIAERSSVVGVPAHAAQQVIDALSQTTIKGKKVKAKPYQDDGR
jgi:ATP-dependent RNA helicase DeaD